ncbi:hypothetical protein ACCO45_013857 [Purpureocillium lilacinum]|uniref:Uncharacterized protein n=1 Tax=Purpureocillium lilacinum TaxID=33203 RepID=A0ACC4D757_PURLI
MEGSGRHYSSLIYESTLRRARRRRLCVHNLRLLPVDASPSFHTLAAHSHGNRSGGSWTATLSRPAETLPRNPRARARSPETLRQKLKEAAPQHGVRCEAFLVGNGCPSRAQPATSLSGG